MKHKMKKVFRIFLVLVVLAGALGGGFFLMTHARVKHLQRQYEFVPEAFLPVSGADRIHFLNTGHSDCILIESNGLFAMVDAGEDGDNPTGRKSLELTGYEDLVVAYLKKVAGDAQGKVTLEWVLGTHAHSDHLGGFDTVILHPDITVKQVYLKEYQEEFISNYEVMRWDNQEVYDQMLAACKEKGVEVLQALPADPWLFGDFTVQFFNTKPHREKKVGENENAVGTKLTVRSYSAFLAADINNIVGTEDEIAPEIGRVDILKLGHHGYTFSTTKKFVETLSPKISIVTNDRPASRVNGNSLLALLDAGSAIYTTGEHDGVIANLTGETIVLTENIHN